jgi:hypothetical protein
MDIEYFDMSEKPEQWPANAIECQLENIYTAIDKFKENPDFRNKEILVSLISKYDLNQQSTIGMHRTTEYEVGMINSLFFEALVLNLNILKTFLYDLVGHKTRTQKIVSWAPEIDQSIEIKEFKDLIMQLKLYHLAYQSLPWTKTRTLRTS